MQRSILRVDTTQQGPVVAPQHVNERQARANSNVVEKDYDSDESMEEDSDSDEEALSTVVAREGRERLFAIDELRQGLIRVLGSAQCDKSMLARTQSNRHGYATPVEKEAEPADEPTFWTKSGRKFANREAARRWSASSSLEGELVQSSGCDGEDSDAEGEIDDATWAFFDRDLDLDMDGEASDDGTESLFDDEVSGDTDMDIDSDEDSDYGENAVDWTEARALW